MNIFKRFKADARVQMGYTIRTVESELKNFLHPTRSLNFSVYEKNPMYFSVEHDNTFLLARRLWTYKIIYRLIRYGAIIWCKLWYKDVKMITHPRPATNDSSVSFNWRIEGVRQSNNIIFAGISTYLINKNTGLIRMHQVNLREPPLQRSYWIFLLNKMKLKEGIMSVKD